MVFTRRPVKVTSLLTPSELVTVKLSLIERPSPRFQAGCSLLYGARGGPINGVFTGLARPKKTTTPLPPKRVARAGSGTFLKPYSGRSQFLRHPNVAGGVNGDVRDGCLHSADVGVSGRANDAFDAIGRWSFDRAATAVHFELRGQMLRIVAMRHCVIR